MIIRMYNRKRARERNFQVVAYDAKEDLRKVAVYDSDGRKSRRQFAHRFAFKCAPRVGRLGRSRRGLNFEDSPTIDDQTASLPERQNVSENQESRWPAFHLA